MSREEQLQEERALQDHAPAILRSPRSTFVRPAVDIEAPRVSPGNRYMRQGESAPVDEQARGYTARVTVTDESVMILPANPKRRFLFFSNDDALGFARVTFGTEATLATGIKLGAGGGGILLDNHVPTAAVFIIGNIPVNPNVSLIEA